MVSPVSSDIRAAAVGSPRVLVGWSSALAAGLVADAGHSPIFAYTTMILAACSHICPWDRNLSADRRRTCALIVVCRPVSSQLMFPRPRAETTGRRSGRPRPALRDPEPAHWGAVGGSVQPPRSRTLFVVSGPGSVSTSTGSPDWRTPAAAGWPASGRPRLETARMHRPCRSGSGRREGSPGRAAHRLGSHKAGARPRSQSVPRIRTLFAQSSR